VKKYRDLLNYFFKLFVKLNNGADQLSRQNEVFRLKLLNQDLREQTFKLKAELDGALTQEKVNQLMGLLTSDQLLMNMLSQDALNVLNKIQELTPNLEKLLDHQRCLVDLFTTENLAVNKNCAEINQKCQIYLEQFDGEEEQQQANEDNMIIDPSATYLDHENMQHYNNDFTMKNSFDQ
jgi:predicted  nucleic acid-binding Zn-ribbon protein